jgi:hypothetical protein
MLDEMRVNDEPLNASDIRQLENTDEIADAGGMVLDESPDELGKHYKTSSTC